MEAGSREILEDDVLLPGDVVTDGATNKPMQVTGYHHRSAKDVTEVWNSDINQHRYDIEPDDIVVELVDTPRGDRYFVPTSLQLYPEKRLDRVPTGPANGDRRIQQKLVRSVMAHVMADLRETHGDAAVDNLLDVLANHWTQEYVNEVAELAEAISAGK